jgi:hypothetical protein
MRKLLVFGLVLLVAAAFTVPAVSAVKPVEDDKNWNPNMDWGNPAFVLNLVGKKDSYNGNDFIDTSRHTIMVPLECDSHAIKLKPNNFVWNGTGWEIGITELPGVEILMTQDGGDFRVTDGNAMDNFSSFNLAPGEYKVYIAVKAKDPKYADAVTELTGWIYGNYTNEDDLIYDTGYYYYFLGTVKELRKSDGWTSVTDLFYVTPDIPEPYPAPDNDMWVFDYLNYIDNVFEDGLFWDDVGYFWEFDNHGNKLIQVRFYAVE